ncbi:hypothetical protein Ciccas_002283 [Cichlidogyrus casuarinus]|uniref:Uncharacterized protein n=1 Tax=Cichlidogyrus casuarinus TaxID=1844966 RepID=A0ABD2QKU9_9PLAT
MQQKLFNGAGEGTDNEEFRKLMLIRYKSYLQFVKISKDEEEESKQGKQSNYRDISSSRWSISSMFKPRKSRNLSAQSMGDLSCISSTSKRSSPVDSNAANRRSIIQDKKYSLTMELAHIEAQCEYLSGTILFQMVGINCPNNQLDRLKFVFTYGPKDKIMQNVNGHPRYRKAKNTNFEPTIDTWCSECILTRNQKLQKRKVIHPEDRKLPQWENASHVISPTINSVLDVQVLEYQKKRKTPILKTQQRYDMLSLFRAGVQVFTIWLDEEGTSRAVIFTNWKSKAESEDVASVYFEKSNITIPEGLSLNDSPFTSSSDHRRSVLCNPIIYKGVSGAKSAFDLRELNSEPLENGFESCNTVSRQESIFVQKHFSKHSQRNSRIRKLSSLSNSVRVNDFADAISSLDEVIAFSTTDLTQIESPKHLPRSELFTPIVEETPRNGSLVVDRRRRSSIRSSTTSRDESFASAKEDSLEIVKREVAGTKCQALILDLIEKQNQVDFRNPYEKGVFEVSMK